MDVVVRGCGFYDEEIYADIGGWSHWLRIQGVGRWKGQRLWQVKIDGEEVCLIAFPGVVDAQDATERAYQLYRDVLDRQ